MITMEKEKNAEKQTPQVCWESVNCNLCGSEKSQVIHHERLPYFGQLLDFTIVRCSQCDLIYTNPRIANVNEAYLEDPQAGHEQWERHGQAKNDVFQAALNQLCKLNSGSGKSVKNASLLDVGCGSGHFLQQAQTRGFTVKGIEPAPAAARYAKSKGLNVEQGDLFEYDMASQKFDVITAWDVIEHVTDPLGMLNICAQWLQPNGIIGLRFPSAQWQQLKALVFHRFLKLSRPAYAPTIHLTFFSEQTFAKMAEKVGLKLEVVKTTPAEANTENFWLDSLKRASNLMLGTIEKISASHLGNLEVYCRKA